MMKAWQPFRLAAGNLFLLVASLASFLAWPEACAFAQIELGSSPNPVGSGARALGMGGAFIAVADDATAASWNPGGLIQLARPEMSVVGACGQRSEDLAFSNNEEASGKQSISRGELNYLSASYPFTFLNRGMIVSLAYQHLYSFSRKWDFPLHYDVGSMVQVNSHIEHDQKGSLAAFGFSYGVRLTRSVSCGLTVNLWEDILDQNTWEQKTTRMGVATVGPISFQDNYTDEDRYSLSGVNFNIGLLWALNGKATVGAVVKTPFTAAIDHERKAVLSSSAPFASLDTISLKVKEELAMPLSCGIGFAYRFSDAFSAALDINQTFWNDFIYTDAWGRKTSFVSGRSQDASDVDPTLQIRLGFEYLFIKPEYVVALRAGVFHDPAPAERQPDNFYGFTLGSGISRGRYLFDIAYQLRYGDEVGKSLVRGYNGDFAQDVIEHTLYTSVIVHF